MEITKEQFTGSAKRFAASLIDLFLEKSKSKFYLLLAFAIITAPLHSQTPPLSINEACALYLSPDEEPCAPSLSTYKALPFMQDTFLYIIPTIAKQGKGFRTYTGNILLIGATGELLVKQVEPDKLLSDAFGIRKLEIDTSTYLLKEDNYAVGYTISYEGSSRVYPSHRTALNLFTIIDEELVKILDNFPYSQGSGENNGWDTGNWTEHQAMLIVDTTQTNGYYNILVRERTHTYIYSEDNSEETHTPYQTKGILKFDAERKEYVLSN